MPPIHIPGLKLGDRVEDSFVVLNVDIRSLDNGDSFTVLTLGNSTGSIDSEPFWPGDQDKIAGVQKGHPVRASGEVGLFRQKKQIKVRTITVLTRDAVDLMSLLPAVGQVDRYWDTLDGWRRSIEKPRLRAVLDLFFEDDAFREKFERCPASIRGHHAQLGGLLKHTTEVAAIARAVARTSGADQDVVLAGVLLHDIGKLEAYSWDGIFDYTVPGSLLGHVVLGALMFDERLGIEPDPVCTEEERLVLLHAILSHHGQLAFGSPVQPMTLEAEVLHWADNASAKTTSVADALNDPESFVDGPVSKPKWALDRRRVYRSACDWGYRSACDWGVPAEKE
jgi:3'-5' exoribonuclease